MALQIEETGVSPEEPISVFTPPKDTPEKLDSVREAGRILAQHRAELRNKKPDESAPEAVEPDEPKPLSPSQAEASPEPLEDAPIPSETEQQDAVNDSLPPIEAPRSWSKDDKETFAALPYETQQRVAERERVRDVDYSKRTQEAAEKLKALEADRQAVTQARQQYEQALPVLLQNLQSQQMGEFSDIRTQEDLTNLAKTDWPRYIQFDAHQKKMAAIQQELMAAQQRQQTEQQQNWQSYVAKEEAELTRLVPEIADPDKGQKLRSETLRVLNEVGFNDEERQAWARGEKISPYDHRMQSLLHDAVRFRLAQQTRKTAAPKPVPPVQRPGTASSRSSVAELELKNLEERLNKSGSAKDAKALLLARRAARR